MELFTCSIADTCSTRSITKKAYHTAATACLGFSVTCGSSMISPATPEIAERFNVSRTVSILALSLFVLGLAVGPMIAAPISEIYGRSVVYKVSACAFMLFVLGAGFSESLASLLVCRFLAGTIGGPVLAVGAGTNADMYNARNRAVASSLFVMMPVSSRSQIRLVNTSY
jgi:MFS family permease